MATIKASDFRNGVTFEMDGVKYQLMQIIAVEGSMVYTLQYHATEVNYPLHTNVVENIRSNFRFG